MKQIFTALLLFAFAAPALAQDWERVFGKVRNPDPSAQVLVLDPSQSRSDLNRYKRVSLADLVVPIAIVRSPERDGRTLELPIETPATDRLLLLRTPASVHSDGGAEVRLRTAGAPSSPNIVFTWKSLTNAGGSPVRWNTMQANRWLLIFFDGDWRLLD